MGTGFVVAVEESHDDAEVIGPARRLQAEVAAPIPVDGAVLTLPAAVGIVTRETSRSTVTDLMRDARAALDAAKRRGPNQWVLFGARRVDDSSRLVADALSLSPVGMGLFDEAERLVDANDALNALLRLGRERLRGMTGSWCGRTGFTASCTSRRPGTVTGGRPGSSRSRTSPITTTPPKNCSTGPRTTS
ncbi:diguanylate cyclase domain-containing protein [Saccharothrix obliqua]|uniref:diguanylate cyclase domain-containing protein n=1 Tax=Saccharothrix obliqua TaxID=2861747 RepID=UPI002150BAC3|nr:diguanylate cyclase [Saccharothrix obliqua]